MNDKLTTTPLGPHIGAEIAGIDLGDPLTQGQFEQIHRALLKYQVLFLRNQPISPRQQRALHSMPSARARRPFPSSGCAARSR